MGCLLIDETHCSMQAFDVVALEFKVPHCDDKLHRWVVQIRILLMYTSSMWATGYFHLMLVKFCSFVMQWFQLKYIYIFSSSQHDRLWKLRCFSNRCQLLILAFRPIELQEKVKYSVQSANLFSYAVMTAAESLRRSWNQKLSPNNFFFI